jgi:hypothetical protein
MARSHAEMVQTYTIAFVSSRQIVTDCCAETTVTNWWMEYAAANRASRIWNYQHGIIWNLLAVPCLVRQIVVRLSRGIFRLCSKV